LGQFYIFFMTKDTIDKNNWYKGVAREFSFFMTHEVIKGYNNMFKEYQHTFFNVLFHSKDGVLTMIRKKSEMKALLDWIENLSEKYIVQQLKKAAELNRKLNQKLKKSTLPNTKTWKEILTLCEQLWIYNMFCIYFGYANERPKIKKIADKHYDLVVEVRNRINDLQSLDDYLKKCSPKIDLSELTADEIKIFLKTKRLPSKKELSERKKEYLLFMKDLKAKRVLKNKIESTLTKYITPENYAGTKKLKGQIVFKKDASGPARIVLKKKDLPTIQKGEILVTIMTNPDFVPYLSKVAGIVTDYGGITCHASIISREMKIPCIVGTKIATQIFKNGDIIKIDSDNQNVKKI